MRRLLTALVGVVALVAVGVTPAYAAEALSPWWRVGTEVAPSYLPPGGKALIVVGANNLGDGEVDGSKSPVRMTDRLPHGLTALQVSGSVTQGGTSPHPAVTCSSPGEVLSCTYAGPLAPYERMTLEITVKVEEPPGAATTLANQMSVEGGGAPSATSTQTLTVSGEAVPFGVQGYELAPLNEAGTPDTQAGSHPFQLSTSIALNQNAERQPVELPKNLRFILPPGLIGDPQAVERCTMANFTAINREVNFCPPGSAVGVALASVNEPAVVGLVTKLVPVFNLVPAAGEPARLGFVAAGLPIILGTAVQNGGDYSVVASVQDTTQAAGFLSSQVTLWGIPGAPAHNQVRGWECVAGGSYQAAVGKSCPESAPAHTQAFLTLPGSCPVSPASEPLSSSAQAESWTQPEHVVESVYSWSGPLEEPLGLVGCEALPFGPQIQLAPETAHDAAVHSASTPTGLSVSVKLPQATTLEGNPEGRAEADVRDTTVTLPAGVQLNPAAANGLAACPEKSERGFEGVGFVGFQKFYGAEREPLPATATFTPTFRFVEENVEGRILPPSCPEASKVGLVHIKTPLLPRELEGAVYLAEPAPNGEEHKNPFDSLIALYIVAEDREAGVLVKLAGKGELNQQTGQLSTSFRDTPQLPFEELRLELFGGQRASLSTPAVCGSYPTAAEFTPWSLPLSASPLERSSDREEFDITENCASSTPLAFSPSFAAQSTSTQAGGFTGFALGLEKPDGQQALTGLSVHLPPGISALLSSLTPCPEPPVGQEWKCENTNSEIGRSLATSGVGSEPVTLPGKVYLTTGYEGAPFGILDETEARAGPFNLGEVYVRSKIEVNRETAAVTITTAPGPHHDGLPTMLKGIPVDLKRLTVEVDRQDFELNPTSCDRTSITGTLAGSEGAGANVSSPFQVGGCEALPFGPNLSASVAGHASKAEGATFAVKITSPGLGQANIQKVDLQLPAQLPSRLSTIQKACPASTFGANPAACDEGSVIGHATIHTPILKSPLAGPAYLVSHGDAAFPDIEFVLQGEGIELILDGKTDIKGGITYSKFESAPDAPFETFETVLPASPHSALTASVAESKRYDLCGESLTMPTTIAGQNGAVIEQATKIQIEGCGGVEAAKVKKPTRAQQLASALKACRKRYKHNSRQRVSCERKARKRYAVKKASARTKAHRASKASKAGKGSKASKASKAGKARKAGSAAHRYG